MHTAAQSGSLTLVAARTNVDVIIMQPNWQLVGILQPLVIMLPHPQQKCENVKWIVSHLGVAAVFTHVL